MSEARAILEAEDPKAVLQKLSGDIENAYAIKIEILMDGELFSEIYLPEAVFQRAGTVRKLDFAKLRMEQEIHHLEQTQPQYKWSGRILPVTKEDYEIRWVREGEDPKSVFREFNRDPESFLTQLNFEKSDETFYQHIHVGKPKEQVWLKAADEGWWKARLSYFYADEEAELEFFWELYLYSWDNDEQLRWTYGKTWEAFVKEVWHQGIKADRPAKQEGEDPKSVLKAAKFGIPYAALRQAGFERTTNTQYTQVWIRPAKGVGTWFLTAEDSQSGLYWHLALKDGQGQVRGQEYEGFGSLDLERKLRYLCLIEGSEDPKSVFHLMTATPKYHLEPVYQGQMVAGAYDVWIDEEWYARIRRVTGGWEMVWLPELEGHPRPPKFKDPTEAATWVWQHRILLKGVEEAAEDPKSVLKAATADVYAIWHYDAGNTYYMVLEKRDGRPVYWWSSDFHMATRFEDELDAWVQLRSFYREPDIKAMDIRVTPLAQAVAHVGEAAEDPKSVLRAASGAVAPRPHDGKEISGAFLRRLASSYPVSGVYIWYNDGGFPNNEGILQINFMNYGLIRQEWASFGCLASALLRWRNLEGAKLWVNGKFMDKISRDHQVLQAIALDKGEIFQEAKKRKKIPMADPDKNVSEDPKVFFQRMISTGKAAAMGKGAVYAELLQYMPHDFVTAFQNKQYAEYHQDDFSFMDNWPSYDDDLADEEDEDGEPANPWREYSYYFDYYTDGGKIFMVPMSVDSDGDHDGCGEEAEIGTPEAERLLKEYGYEGHAKAMMEYWEWVIEHGRDPLNYVNAPPPLVVKKSFIAGFVRDGERLKLWGIRNVSNPPSPPPVLWPEVWQKAQEDADFKKMMEWLVVDQNGYTEATEQQVIDEGGKWDKQDRLVVKWTWEDREAVANEADRVVQVARNALRRLRRGD